MNEEKIRISVVIVNYKSLEYTKNCIKSLLCSNIPFLIYLVDNTPYETGIIRLEEEYPCLRILKTNENLGFSRANNLAIKNILENYFTEFIFLLNNDALVEADTLQKLETSMDEHPEAGIIVPKIVTAENPSLLWYGGGGIDWVRGGGKIRGYMGSPDQEYANFDRSVDFASGCAMLVRAKVFMEVGLFDARFFMYEEDLNFSVRTRLNGWSIWYNSSALVRHIMQGSLRNVKEEYRCPLSHNNLHLEFYLENIVKNRLINGIELTSGMNRIKFFIGYPLFLLVKSFQYLAFGKVTPVIVIIKSFFEGLKSIRKKHKSKNN